MMKLAILYFRNLLIILDSLFSCGANLNIYLHFAMFFCFMVVQSAVLIYVVLASHQTTQPECGRSVFSALHQRSNLRTTQGVTSIACFVL